MEPKRMEPDHARAVLEGLTERRRNALSDADISDLGGIALNLARLSVYEYALKCIARFGCAVYRGPHTCVSEREFSTDWCLACLASDALARGEKL